MKTDQFIRWPVLFFFFIFNLGLPTAFGQLRVSITGKVMDGRQSGVAGADVILERTRFRTRTDSSGSFRISDIPTGRYQLICFAPGMASRSVSVVLEQKETRIDLALEELAKNLNPVEIQAERERTFGLDRMKSVDNFGIYEGKKTEVVVLRDMTANLATNNPRQIYSKVTGLNIWESDGAGLQLGIGGRGLSPNRTANFNVRQNGYDISADALGYPESYYTPPAEALDQIEIIRGAASLQYGTQFGGLLNFRFRKGPRDKKLELTARMTGGSWGFFNSFTRVGGTVSKGKLNYFSYIQYKRGDGFRKNSGFDYVNTFGSVTYDWSPRFQTGLEITKMQYLARQPGGLTDKNFQDDPRQSLRSRNWFSVDWNLVALTATWKISPRLELNSRNFGMLASRQALGNLERINVIDFGGNRTLIEGIFANLGNENRLLYRYSLPGGSRHTLLIGNRIYRGTTTARQGDGNNGSGADFRFLNPGDVENSDYRFPNHNYALYAENIFNLGENLSLTPGVRWEYISTRSDGFYKIRSFDGAGNLIAQKRIEETLRRNRSFLLAGLGISYKPSELLELYGNVSQNYRAINFSDLRIVNPNFIVDTNIRDEKGFTADLGIRGKKTGRLVYEVTAFYLFYQGKIGQVLRADRPPLYVDYRYRSNISDARNIGLEMFAELELLHWKSPDPSPEKDWKLSLFGNFAVVDARYVNTQDPTIRGRKVEMVPPFMLRSGISVRKLGFSASVQYSRVGQHFSDATNAIRTATAVEGVIPAYSVLDVSARVMYRRFALETSLNNLLNTRYFTRRAESYPGPGIIPSDGRSLFVTLAYRL